METNSNNISWNDFDKIEMYVGTIIDVLPFESARNPAYILKIDFGEFGIKKSSAQITVLYKMDALIGKQVIAVLNFPEKQIGNFFSECLVLGAVDGKSVSLLTTDIKMKNGLRIG